MSAAELTREHAHQDEAGHALMELGDERQWLVWLTEELVHTGHGREQVAAALIARLGADGARAADAEQAHDMAGRALQDFETLLCDRIVDRIGDAAAEQLETLVGNQRELLGALQADVSRIRLGELVRQIDGLASLHALGLPVELLTNLDDTADRECLSDLVREIDKLAQIRSLCLPTDAFDDVPATLVQAWFSQAVCSGPDELAHHPRALRLTLLSALCHGRRMEITDLLGSILVGLLHRIRTRAEHRLEQDNPAHPSSRQRADAVLHKLVRAALAHPDDTVRAALYPVVSERELRKLLAGDDYGTVQARRLRAALRGAYSAHHEQVVKLVLGSLEFRCADAGCWAVLAALGELAGDYTACWGSGRFYDSAQDLPLDEVVPPEWRAAVVGQEGRVDRAVFELCVLLAVRDLLCLRRIFLAGGGRWGEPGSLPMPVGALSGDAARVSRSRTVCAGEILA
ncbi:hypothetical protein [Saccharopolyspora thermophila]|uniref:hypothetical protein n=1 Tax=Saccharopolyspora thermophila TaxID=89367 RepID=UPI0031F8CC4E